MKPTDFDELFWFSDPESMGRIISEKYNLNDFYNADLSSTLYQRCFSTQKPEIIPKININICEELKLSF